jgi:hypothetical protein
MIGIIAFVACIPGQSLVAGDKDDLEKVEYFPLKVGTTWEYLCNGKKIVTTVTLHEKVDEKPAARLDTTMDGTTVIEHLTITKDGLCRILASAQRVHPPWLILKLPAKVGEKWNVNLLSLPVQGSLSILEAKKLKVGLQEYDTLLVVSTDLKLAGQDVEIMTWYAKDVGMVKQTVKQPTVGLDITLELEKFTPGK